MTYEIVAKAVQQGGTVYFVLMFLAACAYAFWPKKRAEFEKAARATLDEADRP
jgi:cytochrome c oxidase cbb3-type subunit 4